ncbi:MAG TPA: hypothetical protein VGG72_33840 [Bryobacteraceae bacterium]|jgi:hypothetical protein
MKKTDSLFATALIGLAAVYGQAIKDPERPNPVRVSSRAQLIASLEQSTVKIGDPLKLHFRLKNISSAAIRNIVQSELNEDCWLMVTDASGSELPLTKQGERLRKPSRSGGGVVGDLLPGADEGDRTIDVSRLYQFDRPGNYFVRIIRRIGVPPEVPFPKYPENQKDAAKVPLEEAVSDPIPFTIIP